MKLPLILLILIVAAFFAGMLTPALVGAQQRTIDVCVKDGECLSVRLPNQIGDCTRYIIRGYRVEICLK